MDAVIAYSALFNANGNLLWQPTHDAVRTNFRHLSRHVEEYFYGGDLDKALDRWDNAGLPSFFMPFKDADYWQIEALTKGRSFGMRDEKLLLATCVSVPIVHAWLTAGRDELAEIGADSDDGSMYAQLAQNWDGLYYQTQLRALEKLEKGNPLQYLKRTDRDGDWDDKEYLRQLKYKQELDREASEQPVQIAFKFGE